MKYKVVFDIETTDDNTTADGFIISESGHKIKELPPREQVALAWHLSQTLTKALTQFLGETYFKNDEAG